MRIRLVILTLSVIVVGLAFPSEAATATRPRQSLGSGAAYGGTLARFWGSTNYSAQCGIGFPWRTSSGYRWVTAGHCTLEGVRSNYSVVGSRSLGGYISKYGVRKYGGGNDLALLTPTYTPRPYIYRGGTKSTTVSAIKGMQSNYLGIKNACVSGAYRGEFCGWLVDYQEATADKAGRNLGTQWRLMRAHYGNSCPIGMGDSGSPIYVNTTGGVKVMGILSGMKRDSRFCYLYYVGWEKVRQIWGGSPMVVG